MTRRNYAIERANLEKKLSEIEGMPEILESIEREMAADLDLSEQTIRLPYSTQPLTTGLKWTA